jgi:hypothetical protein
MKKIRNLVLILGIALGIGLVVPVSAHAASVIAAQCAGVKDSAVCNDQNDKPSDLVAKIVNTLLFIVGALSVVVIIVGGILYATSAGDSGRVTTAKNTITYAIVGLVVSFLAFAIVNFVIVKFTK